MKLKVPKIGGLTSKSPAPEDPAPPASEGSSRSSVELELGVESAERSSTLGEIGQVSEVDGAAGDAGGRARISDIAGRLRSVIAWSTFLTTVFVIFAWLNLPTKAIAWRISQEAKAQGFIVEIDDVSITPWGSVTLHDVAWHFATKRAEETPVPFISEEMTLRVGVISYLLGELDVSLTGDVDSGAVEMAFEKSSDGSGLVFDLIDVPLYALPKVQQTMNAPVRGELSLHVEIASPDESFSKASGEVTIDCRACVVGDGETKLYVSGAKGMLANGMTVPEIDFGAVSGSIIITDGKGEAKDLVSKSEDVTIKISGDLRLADPIGKSELDMRIKLFISEKMRQDNADIGLMMATASKKVKLTGADEGGLGYRLMGAFGRPKLRSFQYKPAQERRDERAEKSRARASKKKSPSKRTTPKPKPKPKPKRPSREVPADSPRASAGAEAVPSGTATPAKTRGDATDADAATPAAFLGARELPERAAIPTAEAAPAEAADEKPAEEDEEEDEEETDDDEAAETSEQGESGESGESGDDGPE